MASTRRKRAAEPIEEFIGRLESLYSDVEDWLQGTDLTSQRSQVTVSEHGNLNYEVPRLEVCGPDGKDLALLMPVGMRILGAGARVDLRGAYGSRVIVYLFPGGPHVGISRTSGDQRLRHAHPLFPGVTDEGWYSIDQVRLKAQRLDRANFSDLLREVSDRGV